MALPDAPQKKAPFVASPVADGNDLSALDQSCPIVRRFHQHSISDSIGSMTSNDSSPTTTISTVDDSSATEPSPGSSPESPPPNTFSPTMLRPRTSDDIHKHFFRLETVAPAKKGRNLKGLAVNTSKLPGKASQSTTSLPVQSDAAEKPSIMSPAFLKPPTPKRKPNALGLSILTPGNTKAPPQQIKLAIPPTPGLSRPATLRHFQSSPSLPVVPGLSFQQQRTFAIPTLDTILSPRGPQLQQPVGAPEEIEEEQNFDAPQSKEEKPEAYPEGPICVWEPFVDLYLEPTAEQVRQYDVVMNVASEVRNPLVVQNEPAPVSTEVVMDGGGGLRHHHAKHTTAAPNGSPTTPKATPSAASFPEGSTASKNEPEYIHVLWEHNTDIVPDLLRLSKLIDDRVMARKRILVHCQCGVSRSASLVVAYGLYKNPSLSVQEVYDMVKKRSRWIGPNMNLIMQLQEFRSTLARGGVGFANRGQSSFAPKSAIEGRNPFSEHRPGVAQNVPMSAIIPASKKFTADSLPLLGPSPSSAPLVQPWPPTISTARTRSISTVQPNSTFVDPAGHVVPALSVVEPVVPNIAISIATAASRETKDESDSATPTASPASPRVEHFAMAPLKPPEDADPADAFGLMSPSSTEFASSPFDRSALLATLGMGSIRPQDDVPRRTVSSRSRPGPQTSASTKDASLSPGRKLRGKISSPSLSEQRQLHDLQAQIESKLSLQHGQPAANASEQEEPLMSPRATEFTQNPFALALNPPAPGSVSNDSLRVAVADPRSPANVGISPITRNIFDVL